MNCNHSIGRICGHARKHNSKYIKRIKLSQNFKQFFKEKYDKDPFGYQIETTLWTSYLGPVKVPVWESPIENEVYLQMTTEDDVLVKVLDINDVMSIFNTTGLPDVAYLKKIVPTSVNLTENKIIYEKIKKIHEYKNSPVFREDKDFIEMVNKQLKELYEKNICVDIFFNTIMVLKYLKEGFNLPNINKTKELISIYNIPDFDNAFFTGEYMVYGNGLDHFYPLASPDVVAHELFHSVTDMHCSLDYEGESGALNESFSDIFASAFEFWLYNNFKDLEGSASWYIGSLIGHSTLFLRNMENPEQAPNRQPYEYKGEYWVSTDDSDDNGGVHTNSGPCNRCFFLISKDITVENSIQIFYKCLCNLEHDSKYLDFAKILISVSGQHEESVKKALRIIKVPFEELLDDMSDEYIDRVVLNISEDSFDVPIIPDSDDHTVIDRILYEDIAK